jgi:hypothetical protein
MTMLQTLVSTVSAAAVLLALMAGWIQVQRAAQRVAEAHPEFGPFRIVGGGCGGHGHGKPLPTPPPAACEACENGSCATSAPNR